MHVHFDGFEVRIGLGAARRPMRGNGWKMPGYGGEAAGIVGGLIAHQNSG
jgi:hypothetical protein